MASIKLLVAEDHEIVRAGLRALLERQPDFEVVADLAAEGDIQAQMEQTRPNVVVIEIATNSQSRFKKVDELHRASPTTPIVVLSSLDDVATVKSALTVGVSGYVLKQSDPSELYGAIRAVAEGKKYLDRSIASDVIQSVLGRPDKAHDAHGERSGEALSQREREVLELVAHGFTNKQIADRLFLSVKTIEVYRSRVGRKLGLRSRSELVRFALDMDLLGSTRLPQEPEIV